METPPQAHPRDARLLVSESTTGCVHRWVLLARLPTLRPYPEVEEQFLEIKDRG
jgi:hypothetical protein